MTSRRRGRARTAHEEGFTLIELLVTLTVMAVGIFGTVRVFDSSLDATASADARSHAQAIAAREVENMLAVPYADLGFASTQSGYRSSFDGASTVSVAIPRVEPFGANELKDGITYSIRRDIVWTPATNGTADAFKRVVATVTWIDDGGDHSVRSDAGVYEFGAAGAGVLVTTTTTAVLLPPDAPTGLTATTSGVNPTHQINLNWNAGGTLPTSWEIERSADSGVTWTTVTASQPPETTSYSVTGLAAATTYQFRVRGANSIGTSSWSNVATAATAAEATCSVLTARATVQGIGGSTVRKKSTNTLNNDVLLEVSTSGTGCSSLTAVIETTPGTSYTVAMTQSGSVYSYSIWKNDWATWSVGNKIIAVRNAAGADVATISLTVTA